MFKTFHFIVLLSSFHLILVQDFKRVCYMRADPEIPVDYIIRSQLCSHIIIGFVSVVDNLIEMDETNHLFLKRCKTTVTESNSNEVLLMLSVGGGNNDRGFHSAALNDANRKKFAISSIEVINKYGLNGIDIDWEFPSWGNLYVDDKNNFNLLLKELRQTFDMYPNANNNSGPLVLSAAVAAQYTIIERSYVIPELSKYVDFINLMTYDYYIFHWYWPFVGHNSPLFARPIELGLFSTFNTKWSANHWNKMGADKSKIIVGIPTYGRSFRMLFRWLHIPGTPVVSSTGDKSYSQICEEYISDSGTTVRVDTSSRVPYGYKGSYWFTYESEDSASEKAKWIKDNGFGGVMTFSLNADDFKNKCTTNELFPIHSAIKRTTI